MKFLQKLFFASGLLGLMAATSDDALREKQSALATEVICGLNPHTGAPMKWTHNEFLGNVGGQPVYTLIIQNRIYIRWDGNPDPSRKNMAFENTAILLHMDNNKFPNNTAGNLIVNSCVNSVDPSTMGNNYIGAQQGNMIPCNNKPITDGMKLGTYIGGDRVKTYQYAIIKDGLLRVNFHRETNTYSRDAISMGLIRPTIEGENGSFMDPNMGFTLSLYEIQSCFWNELPKYPNSVIDPEPNCPGGPTLGSISNVSQTGLRFSYSGNGIPNIDWRIKSGGTVVRSAKTGSLSSNNVDISFGTLSAGNYTLEIEGGDCASSVSSANFTVNQPNCPSGPTVSGIRNVSPTGLTVDFNGSGVPNLTWRVVQGGSVIRNGKTSNLSSNSASISYNILGAGTYSLEIEGGDCSSSVSTSNFTITPGTCPGGPTLGNISNISSTALRFQFDGNGVPNITWRIKSGATVIRNGKTPGLTSSLVDISYAALSGGNYTLEIEGGDCISSVSSKTFDVGSTVCPGGPSISGITNITSSGLTVNFNGVGVSSLTWRIKQGGNTVANGRTGNLTSNSANITFASLGTGTYALEIEGGNCTSTVSSSNFTISQPICASGPTITNVKNISGTGLTVDFNGSGIPNLTWRIKQSGNVVRNGKTGNLSANTASITFASLGAGTYSLEIEGGDCTSAASSSNFNINPGTCPGGPTLGNITNISSTALRFQFDGNGVPNITWRIKSGDTVVRNGKTPGLTSSLVDISYAALSGGNYTLEIEGGDCISSVSSKTFDIGATVCPGGPSITGITNVISTGLTVNFNGSGVSSLTWRIKQGGNTVANGRTGNLTSNSANITFANLGTGIYALEIEGGNCTSTVSSSNFTIAPGNCPGGPTLGNISNISATALRFQFDGVGVPNITWRIKSGGTVVRNGKTGTLTSSLVDISFASLGSGDYSLEIEGGDCASSVSAKTFAIGLANCGSGPTISAIRNISNIGLTVDFNGTGVSSLTWRVKQGANIVTTGTTGNLGSNSATISFGALAVGTYSLEIQGANCVSTVSASNFNVTLPNCSSGPTITSITNVSTVGLTVNFSGTNIPNLTWRLKKAGSTVANGKTGNLSSASAVISFPAQALGNYTLEIEGGDCISSVSSRSFDITTSDTRLPCEFGPNLISIYDQKETELVFNFHGSNVASIDWRIMKGSTMMRSSRISLTSDRPKISYATLEKGNYTLQIEGGSCKSSVQTMAFSIGTALPIHISKFEGAPVNDGVELSWNVTDEKDGKGFEVIRYDSQVKAASVIGTLPLSDKRVGEYQFTDKAPRYGNNYYQLKMIDEDGTFLTSRLITVRYEAIGEAVLAPNPVRDFVNVEFVSKSAGKGQVETYNMSGIKLNTIEQDIVEGKNKLPLNVTGLNDGHYFLKVYYGDQEMNLRFFKVR